MGLGLLAVSEDLKGEDYEQGIAATAMEVWNQLLGCLVDLFFQGRAQHSTITRKLLLGCKLPSRKLKFKALQSQRHGRSGTLTACVSLDGMKLNVLHSQ